MSLRNFKQTSPKRIRVIIVFAILVALGTIDVVWAAEMVKQTVLGKLHSKAKKENVIISPDSKRFAYYVAGGEALGMFVVADGVAQRRYEGLGGGTPVFSPDGVHVVYQAEKPDGKWVLVVDGKEVSGTYDSFVYQSLALSERGGRSGCVAKDGKKSVLLIDGNEKGAGRAIAFSPDGKHVAWIDELVDNLVAVVVDGHRVKEYALAGGIQFSPDGKRIAWIAGLKGKQLAVIDGNDASVSFDALQIGPKFSPDSRRVAYIGFKGDASSLRFSIINGWSVVMVDGKEMGRHHGAAALRFSADSRRVCWVAAADKGAQCVVVDGKQGPGFETVLVPGPVFSEDGRNLAYVGRQGKRDTVIVNGAKLAEYDQVHGGSLAISPGGQHVAFFVKKSGKWYLCINGVLLDTPYDYVPDSTMIIFNGNKSLRTIAIKNREIRMLNVDLLSAEPFREQRHLRANSQPKKGATQATLLPSFEILLKGRNEVRVKNPNDFEVIAGVRKGNAGMNLHVSANGSASVFVPDGRYDIFFVYTNRADALFQGDSFTLNHNGVEIRIVKVVDGNYGIRRVK